MPRISDIGKFRSYEMMDGTNVCGEVVNVIYHANCIDVVLKQKDGTFFHCLIGMQ